MGKNPFQNENIHFGKGFLCYGYKFWKVVIGMLKVRLSGTKNELRRFVKNMSRSRQYDLETISDFKSYKGNKKFRILYVNLRKKEKQ